MNHEIAQNIFIEIRERPYAWSSNFGEPANNCYFKGIELLQRLGILGYAVRGRVGETYLDSKTPPEIVKLYPAEFLLTHFWVEAEIDGNWQILDVSYDTGLSKAGFVVNDWESNRTCFDITKTYSQTESIIYQQQWNDEAYSRKYFEAIKPCAQALNKWFQAIRS